MWLTVSKDCSVEVCQHLQNLQNQDHERIFQLIKQKHFLLNENNGTRTHKHLVCKQTLNHLAFISAFNIIFNPLAPIPQKKNLSCSQYPLLWNWIFFLRMSKINPNILSSFEPQPHKMVTHTQTIHRQQPKNCLSEFNHFVGLALKGLKFVHINAHKNYGKES